MNVRNTLLAAMATVAISPVAALAQDHGAEGGGNSLFSINPGLSIWTIVVFLMLMFVLGRFAWGPILKAVDERERRIQESLDAAKKHGDEIQALVAEQKQQLAMARQESQAIVAEGREAGERVRKDIEEKARTEGQAMLERARAEIGRERDAALDELRRESVELAIAAASRLLGERLDTQRDRELATSYVDELQRSAGGAEA